MSRFSFALYASVTLMLVAATILVVAVVALTRAYSDEAHPPIREIASAL